MERHAGYAVLPKAHALLKRGNRFLDLSIIALAARGRRQIVKRNQPVYKFGDTHAAVAVLKFYSACVHYRVVRIKFLQGFGIGRAGLGKALLRLEKLYGVRRSISVDAVSSRGHIAELAQSRLKLYDSFAGIADFYFLIGIIGIYLIFHDPVHERIVHLAGDGKSQILLEAFDRRLRLCAVYAVSLVIQIAERNEFFLKEFYILASASALHGLIDDGRGGRRRRGRRGGRGGGFGRQALGCADINIVVILEAFGGFGIGRRIVNEKLIARRHQARLISGVILIGFTERHIRRVFSGSGAYAVHRVFGVDDVEIFSGVHKLGK